MIKIITTSIIFLIHLLFSYNAVATNYFSWDVDNNPVSATNPTMGVGALFGATTFSTEEAQIGTTSLKFNVNGNDNGNQQLGVDFAQANYPFDMIGSPKLYYRWYMLIKPGFSWGNGTAKTKSSRTLGGSNDPRGYTGYIRKSGFQLAECEPVSSVPGGGCPSQGVVIPFDFASQDDGRWHEYVVAVKFNTSAISSDAEFDAWVDGVFVGSIRNFRLHGIDGDKFTQAWGGWMTKPYFQLRGTSTDGGIIYVDNFSVDDDFNSIAIFGPTSPTQMTITN